MNNYYSLNENWKENVAKAITPKSYKIKDGLAAIPMIVIAVLILPSFLLFEGILQILNFLIRPIGARIDIMLNYEIKEKEKER